MRSCSSCSAAASTYQLHGSVRVSVVLIAHSSRSERYRPLRRPCAGSRSLRRGVGSEGPGRIAPVLGSVGVSDREVVDAVAAVEDEMLELLSSLVEAPTTLGNEEPGQELMEQAFRDLLGLEPVDIRLDAGALRDHPLAAPFSWDVEGKRNVVADWPAVGSGGRSLVLNGHIDVVGPASEQLWRNPPFRAVREDEWLYGRGSGDMKAGLAAIVCAVLGLQRLGFSPRAPVQLQSVVEEECGGNGALQCVLSGLRPDAAVIPEPYPGFIPTTQVGVLWFHVDIAGAPAHVGEAQEGVTAIE